jgi:hypothetical protein
VFDIALDHEPGAPPSPMPRLQMSGALKEAAIDGRLLELLEQRAETTFWRTVAAALRELTELLPTDEEGEA